EDPDPLKWPTKYNMRMALCWLMQGCQPGDSLVFHFSGHASCIIDACHSGTMLDLPFLCRMDRRGRYIWEDHRPRSGTWKGASGGEAISFSSCDDNQTSADTSSLTDIELFNLMLYERALSNIPSIGAITYSFIQASELGHGTTYGRMLTSMRSTIYHL
ncbi:hypothetical protein CISIN_1g039205mg, partial [Citrus sinensis]